MAENPLKYGDFVIPDSSITDLIAQLKELNATYVPMMKSVKDAAASMAASMEKLNGATIEGRKPLKDNATEADKLAQAYKKLEFAQSDTAKQIAALNLQIKEQNQTNKSSAQIAASMETTYNRLSAEYTQIKMALNKMTLAERENTAEGKAMVAQSNQIYQSMIKLQTVTGKHTLSVGNYAKSWDGLGNSASQLVRELPSLAMSANMFFLAISNNIPIMVDEINRLRIANAKLNAEGTKTPAIWKTVLKSFMSWNTVIMVAVSLLTIFGKDIVAWIGKLFKGEKAINSARIAQQSFNEAVREGHKDSQKEITRLKLLYDATQDHAIVIGDRKKAVNELQKLYPEYFKNMTDESILAGNASGAYKELTNSIIQTSLARAAENQMVKNSEKILTLEEKVAKQKSLVYFNQMAYDKAVKKTAEDTAMIAKDATYAKSVVEDARVEQNRLDILNESKKGLKALTDEIGGYEAANKRLAKTVTISSILTKDPKTPKGPKDRTQQINKENLDLIKGQKEAELALLTDESKKYTETSLNLLNIEMEAKRKKLIDEADAEIAILKNKLANDKDVNAEGKAAINATIIALEQGLTNSLNGLLFERQLKEKEIAEQALNIEQGNIDLRLASVREGTEEELTLRVESLENQRKIALLKNSILTKELRQDESLINKKFDKQKLDMTNDFWYKKGLMDFDNQQALEESEFNLIEHSEKKKKIFRLEQEKARWEMILTLSALYGRVLTQTEVDTMKNIIAAIKKEIKDEKGFKGVGNYVYEMLGLDDFEDYKDAMGVVLENIKNNISSIIDSWVELTQVAVDSANKQVEAAQSIYDGEIEARQKGYASNVTLAQKELALAKKTQEQALREKAKAQRAQAAIDSVTQASSLITATAEIFNSLSGIPVIGWALAIAAVAAMWGTFAYAKIKANQVTKAQTYGEGGYEFLEGGSHASGNDIPIGRTKDGKPRKAEGGETLAIIRKSRTSQYRKIIPDVINSLNKGTFEQRYMGAYDSGGVLINVAGNTAGLEKDVRAIREQNERKTYVVNGRVVETYKNLKTIYK